MKHFIVLLLLSSSAIADESVVTFTRSDLFLYAQAMRAAGVAEYTANQAKSVQDKINGAFNPVQEPQPDAKQVPKTGPNDGSGSPQPSVRQEGGSPR